MIRQLSNGGLPCTQNRELQASSCWNMDSRMQTGISSYKGLLVSANPGLSHEPRSFLLLFREFIDINVLQFDRSTELILMRC
jgi:hypothetical protein